MGNTLFTLRDILILNRDIILFGYGLVFFIMGLSIALQSRPYSRLELALSLKWLAAFGISHGLHEWGDLFIPIQATYLSQPVIQLLSAIQLVLLAISFTVLFEFGMALLRPQGRAVWLHSISIVLLVGWVFVSFFVILPLSPDLQDWYNTSNALARYFIGFPGGVLAAVGLRRQTYQRIAPLNLPAIVTTLRITGLALFTYALLAGLVPPPVKFFPGDVLNTSSFVALIGVSPLLLRSIVGLVLLITMLRALEVFEMETDQLIEQMEQQQILTAERERIGRELHDGAIQKVYTAGLLIQSASGLAEAVTPVVNRLAKASEVLNDAIADLRQSLGELNEPTTGETLLEGLRKLESDERYQSMFEIKLNIHELETISFSNLRATHVLAIVREALSNVARHTHSKKVIISASYQNDRLLLSIQDYGPGLPVEIQAGYGLRNMRDRARLLGGQLTIQPSVSRGTLVCLDVPWKDER